MFLKFLFGLFVLLLFCGGMAWVMGQLLKRSYDPASLIFRWLVTLVVVVGGIWWVADLEKGAEGFEKLVGMFAAMFLALVMVMLWGFPVLGRIGEFVGGLYTGGNAPPEPAPLYSVAESRRKQGRYREAIWEIQAQLAKFPHDVIGQMMIAEILAENLDDLPGAQLTIERFCAQPGHGPKNIAFALNSLADWHLKYHQDVEAARQAVQKIIDLTPDTETAMHAAQRLARLADPAGMAATHDRQPLQMRSGKDAIGLRGDSASLRPAEISPEDQAAQLVTQLEAHPLDAESREKLAAIYSDHYSRLDMAVDQLDQLINAPNQPAKDVARWLHAIADLQVKHGADYESVQATLQRIIDRFPGVAAENLAKQRIEYLRLELKGQDAQKRVELGSYERNLGLKRKH